MMCAFCNRHQGEEGARLVPLVHGRLQCDDGSGCKKGYLEHVPPKEKKIKPPAPWPARATG